METKSNIDQLGRCRLTEKEIMDLVLSGKDIDSIWVADPQVAQEYNELNRKYFEYMGELKIPEPEDAREFHQNNCSRWLIPDKYMQIDILDYLLARVETDIQRQRIKYEYELYCKHNLLNVLRTMIYLVDQFREHGVVWGVGRGSSVSSYILYIIGINRVDPLKYNLSVDEFFK